MWDSLLQHALRAVYQSSIWYTSLQSVQMVPSPEGWGWCKMDGTWKPVWMTLPEAAKACLELLKCGCKQGCTGRCQCRKANLPCTGLCQCSGECTNNEHWSDLKRISSKWHVAIQFSKYFSSLVASEASPGHISVSWFPLYFLDTTYSSGYNYKHDTNVPFP